LFNRTAYRDKEVVGVFVRFRAPLHPACSKEKEQQQQQSRAA
jgi:hypothetical protein